MFHKLIFYTTYAEAEVLIEVEAAYKGIVVGQVAGPGAARIVL